MGIKIFDNIDDFFGFVENYDGELTLKIHCMVYDKVGNLIAQLIKDK